MRQHTYPLDLIHFFKQARLVSYLSDGQSPGRKMGAVLHRNNILLSYGCNSFSKTHTIQGLDHPKQYLHAEISALIKRRHFDNINTCQMTVYRENRFGLPTLAKPCVQCQAILKAFGIKKIYYSMSLAPFFDVLKL